MHTGQLKSPDGACHVQPAASRAAHQSQKIKNMARNQQRTGDCAQHGGAQQQINHCLQDSASGVFSFKEILIPSSVQYVVNYKKAENCRAHYFMMQVFKQMISHEKQEQNKHRAVNEYSDYLPDIPRRSGGTAAVCRSLFHICSIIRYQNRVFLAMLSLAAGSRWYLDGIRQTRL